jgi:hypothetical protein
MNEQSIWKAPMRDVRLPNLMFRYFVLLWQSKGNQIMPWVAEHGEGIVIITFEESNTDIDAYLQDVYQEFRDSDWKGWL